jgi:hypothetical protein
MHNALLDDEKRSGSQGIENGSGGFWHVEGESTDQQPLPERRPSITGPSPPSPPAQQSPERDRGGCARNFLLCGRSQP